MYRRRKFDLTLAVKWMMFLLFCFVLFMFMFGVDVLTAGGYIRGTGAAKEYCERKAHGYRN